MAHGCQGVFYFVFQLDHQIEDYRLSPIDEHGERTETFGWLARVNKAFLKTTAAWFNELEFVRVTHYGKAYGGFELFKGTRLIRRIKSSNEIPLILSEFTDKDGIDYIAVTNNSMSEPTRIELIVNGIRPSILINGWNDNNSYDKTEFVSGDLTSQGEDFAAVRLRLAPGQLMLLRISSDV